MMHRTPPRRAPLATAGVVAGLVAVALLSPALAENVKVKDLMRFAAEMAASGNWREARYRWEQIVRVQPNNPKVYNNLAVASEALGKRDAASGMYEKAVELSNGEPRIRDNHRRFVRFGRRIRELAGEPPDQEPSRMLPAPTSGGTGAKEKGKVERVSVGLPVPPRLDLEGIESVLVTNFLTEDTGMLDTSRELVKFLRSEFRKQTDLDVPDIVPAPAIPEQTLEDLIANHEFWKYLAREYGVDMIVTGIVRYDRTDVSGFQEVDVVSSRTGQKIRQTRFVEQEDFSYALDVLFIEGASGTLMFRDRVQRSIVFRGLANDPITAFYELSDSIAFDVLSVVTTRTRVDTRIIFKN